MLLRKKEGITIGCNAIDKKIGSTWDWMNPLELSHSEDSMFQYLPE
jgi:hypothetical protein